MIDLANAPIIGYSLDRVNIPEDLDPLLNEVVDSYAHCHPELTAVYVIGSVALGEYKPGISDIDVMGVTNSPNDEIANRLRQDMLGEVGKNYDYITFIDNNSATLDNEELRSPTNRGKLSKLALTGVSIWGNSPDLSKYIPDMHDMTYGRTERAAALMQKYRSGDLIQPFRDNPRLLARSCAKAAMRVMSGMTLLRGAAYFSSPYRSAEEVDALVPEAAPLKEAAMHIINRPSNVVQEAMVITDESVRLFYELFPATIQNNHD